MAYSTVTSRHDMELYVNSIISKLQIPKRYKKAMTQVALESFDIGFELHKDRKVTVEL